MYTAMVEYLNQLPIKWDIDIYYQKEEEFYKLSLSCKDEELCFFGGIWSKEWYHDKRNIISILYADAYVDAAQRYCKDVREWKEWKDKRIKNMNI